MDRRTYLASVGTAATAIVAGCSADTDDEQEGTDPSTGDRPNEPPAAPEPLDEPAEDIEPEPEPEKIPDDPVDEEEFSDEDFLFVFETVLANAFTRATVRSIERHNESLVLEYETPAVDEQTVGTEIAQVAGVFSSTVTNGWDVETLFAYVFTPGQSRYSATYSIQARNASAYSDGSLSAEEYLLGIFDTIEVHE